MAKFLAVHPVGKEFTVEAGTPFAKAGKANLTTDAYWIKSWYVPDEGKLYCEWDAKNAEAIRHVIAKAEEASFALPTEGIYEITMAIDSEGFR